MTVLNGNQKSPINLDDNEETVVTENSEQQATTEKKATTPANPAEVRLEEFATRSGITNKQGGDKTKLALLAAGLLMAILFLMFAQLRGKGKKPTEQAEKPMQAQKQTSTEPQLPASSVPGMDSVHLDQPEQGGDRVSPNDIERTKKPDYERGNANNPPHPPVASAKNLGSVPPFKDTQQTFENPAPYGSTNTSAAQQEQNALKDASLVYVKSAQPSMSASTNGAVEADAPRLELEEGTRISARLDTQISTAIHAPVVAVIEYTYAIGDQVIVPAGARVYGKLTQADATSGTVGVDFDEIELLDGAREKITAIGEGLDLGPIKGDIYGRHNGRNFMMRAMTGLASTAAMVVGNNTSGAYSMDDAIRERAADNIGMAGDAQLMTLNTNTHLIVSVPANTRIYVVWTAQRKTAHGNKPAAQRTESSAIATQAQP